MSLLLTGGPLETSRVQMKEQHLGFAIMWEGDLELHTNKEKMKQSFFGERILHGDTVTAILLSSLQNVEPFSKGNWKIIRFHCSYQAPVYIGEQIWGEFTLVENQQNSYLTFQYKGWKGTRKLVSTGEVTLSKVLDTSLLEEID